jgi:hypothetical protein
VCWRLDKRAVAPCSCPLHGEQLLHCLKRCVCWLLVLSCHWFTCEQHVTRVQTLWTRNAAHSCLESKPIISHSVCTHRRCPLCTLPAALLSILVRVCCCGRTCHLKQQSARQCRVLLFTVCTPRDVMCTLVGCCCVVSCCCVGAGQRTVLVQRLLTAFGAEPMKGPTGGCTAP